MSWGDHLRWVFTIVPSFCVTHGILWSASGDLVRKTRASSDTGGDNPIPIPRKLPEPLWAWYNLKGDAAILIAHFFFGLFVLALIECEVDLLFSWCPSISFRSCRSRQSKGPVLIKDDDVIAEEARVALQRVDQQQNVLDSGISDEVKDPTKVDCIRIHNFQKVYEPSF